MPAIKLKYRIGLLELQPPVVTMPEPVTPNFRDCTNGLGAQSTPTLDATQAADKGDPDTGVSTNDELKAANGASSSSAAAEGQVENKQPEEKAVTSLPAFLSLDSTEKEPLAIVPADGNHAVFASFESDQPGAPGPSKSISPSAANKGKRKSEDTESDGPQAPAKTNRQTLFILSESEAFWRDRPQKPFEDSSDQAGTSSGIPSNTVTQLMGLPEEPAPDQEVADPMDIQLVVEERRPEETLNMFSPPIVIRYRVQSFGIDFASNNIVPFQEEFCVEDPENLGMEGLNITTRP